MEWAKAALDEIDELRRHWVVRHGWSPSVHKTDDAIELFVRITSRRLANRIYVIKLAYGPEWREAGRREDFVDPDDYAKAGRDHWPVHGTVRAVLTNNNPGPAICLKGTFGYHSMLHTTERPAGTSLGRLLLELQGVFDET